MPADTMSKNRLQALSSDPEELMQWIRSNLQNVSEEELENCIYGDKPLTDLILSNLNLADNPVLKPFIKSMIRSQWDLIEGMLTDPQKIYNMIIDERPDLEDSIASEEGIQWLNNACSNSYNRLYNYAWE